MNWKLYAIFLGLFKNLSSEQSSKFKFWFLESAGCDTPAQHQKRYMWFLSSGKGKFERVDGWKILIPRK